MIYLWIYAVITLRHLCTADNLALLSGTLRTYQKAGCDDDVVTLKCPPGTSISVEVAQYGKYAASKHLCPPDVDAGRANRDDDTAACLWPQAMQYSLLQTVVEACQKKSRCQFQTSPATFDGDPCPGERKYVEVAYKCRPTEFRSRVACENERIQLQCNPNSRVAIYSASYGRTEYDSFQCPQPQGVAEETCLVSYATETVMQICHGKRRCEISADASTFGNPCRPHTRMYLRIAYTCVPRNVLNKQYEGLLENDEVNMDLDVTYDQDDFAAFDANNALPASPPTPNVEQIADNGGMLNITKSQKGAETKNRTSLSRTNLGKNVTFHFQRVDARSTSTPIFNSSRVFDRQDTDNTISVTSGERDNIIGFISAWINTYTYVSQNHQRFYLYLLGSIGGVSLLCTVALISRILLRRHRAKRAAQGHAADAGDGSVAHGFIDDISEVDADIDLSPPSDVVFSSHYGGGGSGGGGGGLGSFGAELPRSVSHAAASVYYYG